MELTLLIIAVLALIFIGILSLLINGEDEIPHNKYQCHKCKKKFKRNKLRDLRGPWHIKEWTCPYCKHQNVTINYY